ncbi:hypothetical protein H1R20_g2835, partial [Candolleomyces eurysporus]
MRAPHKAIQWAQETQAKGLTLKSLVWNAWLMLALPAIWLVWSLLFYIICIMIFVWRVRIENSPGHFDQGITAAARVGISLILAAGLAYLVLAVRKFVKFSENHSFKTYFNTWMTLKQKSASSSWVVIESSDPILPKAPASHQYPQDTMKSSTGVSQPGHGQGAPHPSQSDPNANGGGNLSNNVRWGAPQYQSPPRARTGREQSDGPARISVAQSMGASIPSIDLELDDLNPSDIR